MGQLSITDTIFSNQTQTCAFGYDEFMRLTSDKCGPQDQTCIFDYDEFMRLTTDKCGSAWGG